MPRRLELSYLDAAGQRRVPVMIHRAILGSVERMVAVLCEHYQGRWPFWLSPKQVVVFPVDALANDQCEHARKVHALLSSAGFAAAIDLGKRPMQAKSKEYSYSPLNRYCFVLVIGRNEVASGSVNVKEVGANARGRSFPLNELCPFLWRVAADSSCAAVDAESNNAKAGSSSESCSGSGDAGSGAAHDGGRRHVVGESESVARQAVEAE